MILDFLIQKLTETNPPELNADKCINSFGKNSNCKKCKEYCPEKAIGLKDNKVIIDENLCNQCGICTAVCPTQAIRVKGTGEDEIYTLAGEKKNLVVACSMENAIGNLDISCLNALHPEFISSLFILHKDKKLHFNLSKCSNCKLGYENTIFKDSLNKAVKFAKTLGINPIYEIHTEETDLSDLVIEEISRRNLFKLVKKESGNMVAKTVISMIDVEDNKPTIRNILQNSIKSLKLNYENDDPNIFWEYWDVNIDCNGCSKCVSACHSNAWKIEKDDTSIKLYYKSDNCYKCGLCEKICPKKAITKGNIGDIKISEFNLKREIILSTCKSCNNKFIPVSNETDECDICKKKELMRRRISTSE